MQSLILAGGRGMKMSPLTDEVPKALLYLPGGTILDYLLHHVTALSIRKTALVLQYRGDQIARHLGGRSDLKLIPQNPPFTRLGALASAASWVKEPTLVFHGGYYSPFLLCHFWPKFSFWQPVFCHYPICGLYWHCHHYHYLLCTIPQICCQI